MSLSHQLISNSISKMSIKKGIQNITQRYAYVCIHMTILHIFVFHRGKGSFNTLRWRRLFIPPPMSGRREKGTERKSKDTLKQRCRRKDLTALNRSEIHLLHACDTTGEFNLHNVM